MSLGGLPVPDHTLSRFPSFLYKKEKKKTHFPTRARGFCFVLSSELATAYVSATSGAVATALGLNALTKVQARPRSLCVLGGPALSRSAELRSCGLLIAVILFVCLSCSFQEAWDAVSPGASARPLVCARPCLGFSFFFFFLIRNVSG